MSFKIFQLNNRLIKTIRHQGFSPPTAIPQVVPVIPVGPNRLCIAQTAIGRVALISSIFLRIMILLGQCAWALVIVTSRDSAEQLDTLVSLLNKLTDTKSVAESGAVLYSCRRKDEYLQWLVKGTRLPRVCMTTSIARLSSLSAETKLLLLRHNRVVDNCW
jgi:hypothetical protein